MSKKLEPKDKIIYDPNSTIEAIRTYVEHHKVSLGYPHYLNLKLLCMPPHLTLLRDAQELVESLLKDSDEHNLGGTQT